MTAPQEGHHQCGQQEGWLSAKGAGTVPTPGTLLGTQCKNSTQGRAPRSRGRRDRPRNGHCGVLRSLRGEESRVPLREEQTDMTADHGEEQKPNKKRHTAGAHLHRLTCGGPEGLLGWGGAASATMQGHTPGQRLPYRCCTPRSSWKSGFETGASGATEAEHCCPARVQTAQGKAIQTKDPGRAQTAGDRGRGAGPRAFWMSQPRSGTGAPGVS